MEKIENKIKEFLKITKSSGSGSGDGSGSGYGYGSGSGDGYGSGSGSGDGSGIKSINGMFIYKIDGIQTIITSIRNNISKGYILNSDMTLKPCYIAKIGNHFAHAETIKQALEEAQNKAFDDMDIDEKIELFREQFKINKKYKGRNFYDWHNKLTGSCEMGRQSFVSNKNINLDDEYTVLEFIKLTENSYGSEVIKELKEYY